MTTTVTPATESGVANTRKNLIDIDDLTREEILEILDSAEGMLEIASRDVRKTPALRGKTIITMFFENSTRTRVSFEQAGKILGADEIGRAHV